MMQRGFLLLALAAGFLLGAGVAAQADKAPSAQVVTDEAAHRVRIMIDGKEVAVIDAAGLHVTGNVTYSGMIVDTDGASPPAAGHAH